MLLHRQSLALGSLRAHSHTAALATAWRAASAGVLVLLVGACSSSTTPSVDEALSKMGSLITTDSTTYRLASEPVPQTEVIATITNRTLHKLYVYAACGDGMAALERRVGERWQVVYTPTCLLAIFPPVVVPPGGTYRSRTWVPVRLAPDLLRHCRR